MAPKPRHTARAIIIKDDKLLLMERWRNGQHYFSIPGGAIEQGEIPEQTAIREVSEETTLIIETTQEVAVMQHGDVIHHIFLANYISGEPTLPADSEEAITQATSDNRFNPCWVPVSDVAKLPLNYWEPLRSILVNGLVNGFDEDVKVVQVAVD